MSKRNLVSEIEDKNLRASRAYLSGHIELFSLEHAFEALGKSNETLFALLVIGVAACIEVTARTAIKRLVDFGNPYLERAEAFKDVIKFDFALTKALSSGKITFGDLVSHSIPLSKVDHISSHFETLFKGDQKSFKAMLSEVRIYVEPSDDELLAGDDRGATQRNAPFLISDVDAVLKDVGSIFEIRHIVAHEANFKAVSYDELSRLLSNARLFVDALYEAVEQTLNPGASRNGYGQSIQLASRASGLRSATEQIQEVIAARLTSAGSEYECVGELFDRTIQTFDEYYETEEAFRLATYGMLTGNGTRNVQSHVAMQLWQHRLDYMRIVDEDTKFLSESRAS